MRIRDYETGREMSDVSLSLTPEEAADMIAYLQRLIKNPGIVRVHLSEVKRFRIERELTLSVDDKAVAMPRHAMVPQSYAV